MDFIERLFGVSPDNGSGTFEFVMIVVLIGIAGLAISWSRRRGAS
jgi:hypothetical protein